MTLFFTNEEITIYRQRRIGNSNRWSVSATFTAYKTDIQPAAQTRQQTEAGTFGSLFTAFVEASVDIKEGDELRTEDGKRYRVKGVQRFQSAGLLDHLELLLTSQDG